jgi:hypothetical protein
MNHTSRCVSLLNAIADYRRPSGRDTIEEKAHSGSARQMARIHHRPHGRIAKARVAGAHVRHKRVCSSRWFATECDGAKNPARLNNPRGILSPVAGAYNTAQYGTIRHKNNDLRPIFKLGFAVLCCIVP